jgi:hypothetical protein
MELINSIRAVVARIRGGKFLTKDALNKIADKLEDLETRVDAIENPG